VGLLRLLPYLQSTCKHIIIMDSMRSLNTSLPGTSPSKQPAIEPPEQLLQAFKNAALSVTTLYKTAAADQSRARSEGYQDALDELLAFLDKEDIGLSDGEGWRIRRWATERLDGRDAVSQHMESDDEADKAENGSSPVLERRQASTARTRTASPPRTEPEPVPVVIPEPTPAPVPEQPSSMATPTGTFTFRSSYPYPQDAEMNESDPSDGSGQPLDATVVSHGSHNPSASITITRPSRTASRHGSQTGRHNTRATNTTTRNSGQKKKMNFSEFFDIGNLGHGKDGFGGGGKRARYT
jgi:hypothetical protein